MIDINLITLINSCKSISNRIEFTTSSSTLIAQGCERVVVGGRGSYVEFCDTNMIKDAILIPKYSQYRINNSNVYYIEYRSDDKSNVKVYYQLKIVSYADYIPGKWYISVKDLYTDFKTNNLNLFFNED